MKKRLLAALLTSALALSLTACGGGTDSSAADGGDTASTHDGPYKISMVLKTNAAEFWNIVQAGAEAYEDEHPDQVSLDIKGPPGGTPHEGAPQHTPNTASGGGPPQVLSPARRGRAGGINHNQNPQAQGTANDTRNDTTSSNLCRHRQQGSSQGGRQGRC